MTSAGLADLSNPATDLIPAWELLALRLRRKSTELVGPLRIPSGVLVTATVANRLAVDSGLQEGDIIHTFNRAAIKSMDDLRSAFAKTQARATRPLFKWSAAAN